MAAPTAMVCFDRDQLQHKLEDATNAYRRVQEKAKASPWAEDWNEELIIAEAEFELARYLLAKHRQQHGC